MKAKDIEPGMLIKYKDDTALVVYASTSEYDEELGDMTALVCFRLGDAFEINLVEFPDDEITVVRVNAHLTA